ncbi:hypothetical protein BpHYR1_013810 [Brachionus plicatilis]|uniref:Uncharacterized protein n=1 Tax=Brachionus plicatilis TaxID=10195 RepID=A0A3M7SWJ1_BRAPC|nr:hypothetical protein BpHYR1_013810 [Brachionus plicatilis]
MFDHWFWLAHTIGTVLPCFHVLRGRGALRARGGHLGGHCVEEHYFAVQIQIGVGEVLFFHLLEIGTVHVFLVAPAAEQLEQLFFRLTLVHFFAMRVQDTNLKAGFDKSFTRVRFSGMFALSLRLTSVHVVGTLRWQRFNQQNNSIVLAGVTCVTIAGTKRFISAANWRKLAQLTTQLTKIDK